MPFRDLALLCVCGGELHCVGGGMSARHFPVGSTPPRPSRTDPPPCRQDSVDGDPLAALERLKFKATVTLAEAALSAELRDQVASTTSVHMLYDVWRTNGSRDVKDNCAVTLAHIFLLKDVPEGQDHLLVPVLSMCCSAEDNDRALVVQGASVQALLKRCACPKPPPQPSESLCLSTAISAPTQSAVHPGTD
jgi:hypothetical protein